MKTFLTISSFLAVWIVTGTVARCQSTGCGEIFECPGCSPDISDWPTFGIDPAARWNGSAEALFMDRFDNASKVLAINTANAAQTLNADDLDFGVQSGFELALRRETRDGSAIELKYFGINDWDANASSTTTPGDLIQINTAVPIFVTAGNSLLAHNSSQLHSFELNLSEPISERINLLAGLRYLELDEFGSLGLAGAGIPADLTTNISNRLYGVQAGGDMSLWKTDGFSLDALGKAGIYGNHASQSGIITSGLGTLLSTDSDTVASFVGELDLSGTFFLTENLSLRCGYRMLAIDNVVTASEQIGATDFFGGTGIDDDASVFYHGAHVGLMLTY